MLIKNENPGLRYEKTQQKIIEVNINLNKCLVEMIYFENVMFI